MEGKSGFVCLKYNSFCFPREYFFRDSQNLSIARRFVKIVRQIEELYRKDAEQQIQAVQNNALLDYREFKWLQQEYARLTNFNDNQTEQMQTFLDQLAEPSVRERIFSIADALIGGQLVAVSSGGGGGNADSVLIPGDSRPPIPVILGHLS